MCASRLRPALLVLMSRLCRRLGISSSKSCNGFQAYAALSLALQEHKHGKIIFMSSIAGFTGKSHLGLLSLVKRHTVGAGIGSFFHTGRGVTTNKGDSIQMYRHMIHKHVSLLPQASKVRRHTVHQRVR